MSTSTSTAASGLGGVVGRLATSFAAAKYECIFALAALVAYLYLFVLNSNKKASAKKADAQAQRTAAPAAEPVAPAAAAAVTTTTAGNRKGEGLQIDTSASVLKT